MKELKFSHITKSGGTSIEELAKINKIYWGKYDLNFNKRWHTPLNELSKELKENYKWFIVCRNPYDRIISEYHCRWGGIGNISIVHDKKQFNRYIIEKIRNRNCVVNFGHYKEQYRYFIPGVHVLRFENLKEDFDNLMNKFNLKLELTLKLNSNKKIFTIKDLEKNTINLINKIYEKDFKIFKYEMILN